MLFLPYSHARVCQGAIVCTIVVIVLICWYSFLDQFTSTAINCTLSDYENSPDVILCDYSPLMLVDELPALPCWGSDVLFEPEPSLDLPFQWPSTVTTLRVRVCQPASQPGPAPIRKYNSGLTQSDWGADGKSAGSSTVLLMTLEPLDVHQ